MAMAMAIAKATKHKIRAQLSCRLSVLGSSVSVHPICYHKSGGSFPPPPGIEWKALSASPSMMMFKRLIHSGFQAKLPEEVDWRKAGAISPVRNQGTCHSCWAFATAAAVEALHKLVTGSLVVLSPQELVDCCVKCNGCQGGWRDFAFQYIIDEGLRFEVQYPYKGRQQNCKKKDGSARVYIDGYKYVSSYDTLGLMVAVSKQPVTADLLVGEEFCQYTGGVYKTVTKWADKGAGLHSVLIVGYTTHKGQRCWIIKNSWGEEWGDKGYGYLSQKITGRGGIMKNPIYPVMRGY